MIRSMAVSALFVLFASSAAADWDGGAYRGLVQAALAADGAPGAAVAVIAPNGVAETYGVGVRTLGATAPVDADTLFGIGSLTKAFAAATVAVQVDQGRMRWDGLVRDYYPALTLNDPALASQFTVRDMLSGRYGVSLVDEIFFRAVTADREPYLRYTSRLPPRAPFRDRFVYSNAMYTTAGAVVETAAGRPWDLVLAETIFAPLGMRRALTDSVRIRRDANLADQHLPDPAGGLRILPWGPYGRETGGGSGAIHASAADMSRWLAMQLAGGVADGRKVLSEASMREMHTPQTTVRDNPGRDWMDIARENGRSAENLGYGFGWYVTSYRGHRMLHHSGGQGGYIAYAALLPDQGFAIAILINGRSGKGLNLALALAAVDAFLARTDGPAPPLDWRAELAAMAERSEILSLSDADRAARRPEFPMRGALSDYAGRYANATVPDGLVVALEGGRLVAKLGLMAAPLTHWHGDTFLMSAQGRIEAPYEDLLTFQLDGRGRVVGLSAQRTLALQAMRRELK